MEIQCTNTKLFELIDGTNKLGQISYDGLLSYKASATAGNDNYLITPTGLFSTAMQVTKNNVAIAHMQMNWKGNIIISFQNGKEFILKASGLLQSQYVLEDQHQQKLLLLDPDFNWAKFSYSYTVSFDNKPQDILLVLLATYSANYYVSAMAGAM